MMIRRPQIENLLAKYRRRAADAYQATHDEWVTLQKLRQRSRGSTGMLNVLGIGCNSMHTIIAMGDLKIFKC